MTRDEQLTYIYGAVASGRALSRVLKDDDGLPSSATFWRWHMEDENIRDNLARARLNGVEVHMEEAVEIADDGTNDWMESRNQKDELIGWRINGEHVARSKLRIETRIKRAQMIAPRKYGPKLDLTTDGKQIAPDLTDAATRAAALLALARERKNGESE